ncbi:MAG: pyridoxal-dependent decarboxylase [Gordonia sp. (in: high G+C Gram-positive bacteria)]
MTAMAPDPHDPTGMHTPAGDLARAVARLAGLAEQRLVTPPALGSAPSPTELAAAAGPTVTAAGLGVDEALRLWREVLDPACMSVDHPRFFAFIPGAATQMSAAFDMLLSTSSVYGGSWLEGAGAAFAENQALRWIADLAGLPATAGGSFVQGGTIGNLSALVAARERARAVRPVTPHRWAVCVTEETHSSVGHSLRTVMDCDLIVVPGDARGRMTGELLRETVSRCTEEQRAGIFAVVATAGSTNLGMVDDLAGIGAFARANGWWLHVDGAYGGAGLAVPELREIYRGIEDADSFIVDPHKWLMGPFDCCALLYRDPAIGRAAHTQHADYLDAVNLDGDWNPSDFAIQLTRRARGLPLWFSLAVHGTDAYREAIARTVAVTHAGADLVRAAEHLDLLVDPELSVLVFARRGWSADDYTQWSARLLRDQIAFVTPTRHRGQVCTRICVVNPLTTVDDLAVIVDSMR